MRRGSRGLKLDYVALHARYLAGESGVEIARSVGIDFTGLYASWKRRGLPIRSTRDAAKLLTEQRPERRLLIRHATAARRGGTDTFETRAKRAATRERLQLGTSELEDQLAVWFDANGIAYTRQKAVGPYNIDFALPTHGLAVEVSGGGHNPRLRANRPTRLAYLEGEGWRLVEVSPRQARLGDWRKVARAVGMADGIS